MIVTGHLDDVAARLAAAPVAVTFGVFDGVHLGHQDLIRRVVTWARERAGQSVILTFARHPLHLLAPVFEPKILTPRDRRLALLSELGVDLTASIEFNRALAGLTPEKFVQSILVERLRAKAVFLGFNNRFGKGGAGDTALLQRLGALHGFEVHTVPPVLWRGAPVSATRIREFLQEGRVRRARELLGRPHRVEGIVVTGAQRGRTIGFPTANLQIDPDVQLPAGGVYAVRVHHDGAIHSGMMNIGVKPTFDLTDLTAEVHLLDFNAELVGETLAVDFVARMRSEKKFESIDVLRGQLERDRLHAQVLLAQS